MLQIRFKRGTAAQNEQLVGNAGTLTIDTETQRARIHDGVTTGGHVLNLASDVQSVQSQIDALGIADVDGLNTALAAKIALTEIGQASGVAGLNPEGVVPTEQLPSYVEDVIEVSTLSNLPATGEIGKLYVLLDTNELYRWSGGQSQYYQISAEVSSTDDLSEGQVNLFFTVQRLRDSFGASGDIAYDGLTGLFSYTRSIVSVNGKTGAVALDNTDVGLDQVQNYGVATTQEAEEATVTDKYVTPSLARAMVEIMGFEDAGGNWVFSGNALPSLQVGNVLTVLADRPINSKRHTLSYANGYLWLGGGQMDNSPASSLNRLYRYDIDANTWLRMADAPRSYMSHSACVDGNTIYFVDGNGGQVSEHFGQIMSYDIVSDSWTELTALSQKTNNSYPTPAVLKDGKILSFGVNSSGTGIGSEVWEYDIALDSWTNLNATVNAAFPEHIEDAIPAGDKTYLISYEGGNGAGLRIYVYDHIANTIDGHINTDTSSYAEDDGAAVYLDGKLVIHSANWTSRQGFVVEYDIASDSWSEIITHSDNSLIYLDIQHDIVLVGTDLYVARGGSASSGTAVYNDFYKLT